MIRTIERMGTGTGDIIDSCTQMGLKQPKFEQDSGFEAVLFRSSSKEQANPHATMQATPQVTPQVKKLLAILNGEMNVAKKQEVLELTDRKNVRIHYIQPAIELALIEPLYPDNPNHPKQKYRLTVLAKELKGRGVL